MGDFNYSEIKLQKRRINLLLFLLFAIGAALVVRLVQLQVVQRGYYRALAAKSHARKFEVPAKRGEIMAHDGERLAPLVLNQTQFLLYADPSLIGESKRTEVAAKLAGLTGDESSEYLGKMGREGEYVVLKTRLSSRVAKKIRGLRLVGIGLAEQQYRTYPEGNLAAQILGFVNGEGAGQYGIEGYFNEELAGKAGLLKAITDTQGNPVPTAKNLIKPPVDGSNIVLTIDRNIQSQVEKHLESGVKATGARMGSVIVIEPSTGRILAMANYPSYHPARYAAVKDYGLFGNAAVTDLFEPGSGFKAFTMAAGLDTGKVTKNTSYTDTGSFSTDGYTVKNALRKAYGRQTMAGVIQRSLNTGVIFVLKRLGGDSDKITATGKKTLHDYIRRFGFGARTGVPQGGEATGFIPEVGNRDITYANMTFGQGLSVSLIQMVMGINAIANGGKLYQPQLIDRIVAPDGTEKRLEPKAINSQVISAEAARDMRAMMVNVVERGSGYAAKMPGYKIAGKTGTAQVARADGKGYDSRKTNGTFVGFLPADNPKFLMMVRISEPKIDGFAELTTVPVFARIAKWLVTYMGIPPA